MEFEPEEASAVERLSAALGNNRRVIFFLADRMRQFRSVLSASSMEAYVPDVIAFYSEKAEGERADLFHDDRTNYTQSRLIVDVLGYLRSQGIDVTNGGGTAGGNGATANVGSGITFGKGVIDRMRLRLWRPYACRYRGMEYGQRSIGRSTHGLSGAREDTGDSRTRTGADEA